MATDLSGLMNFKNKLQKYSSLNTNLTNELAEQIAIRGEQIAREEYSSDKVQVYHENLGSGRSRVVAKRDGLAYIEFGTGDIGKSSNYPEENLPKEGVPITGKWEYYYEPSDSKTILNGQRGWWFGKTFTTGRPAGMQMYKTSQKLRTQMGTIVKNKIRSKDTNV